MSQVKELGEESQLAAELAGAGSKLVVVDFTASWCGPCKRIAPFFQDLASKYTGAVFLKIDVDVCPETASKHEVTAMPTFLLFRGGEKLAKVQGADQQALEAQVKQHYGQDVDGEEEVRGMVDLAQYIDKANSECLNEDDDHPFHECLTRGDGFLQSDCDEQLIISLSFTQVVKVHSIKVKAPSDSGPKTLRLFLNQPNTLDFDKAAGMVATQDVMLSKDQLQNGSVLPLKFVNFQNVQNINLFIKDNQGGEDITRIDYLGFIGTPITTTNMTDFKRVAGNKGESGH
jgi:thioredoxin